jgi:DNA polymerase
VEDTSGIIKEVRNLMKFYQELGFEYLPVSLQEMEVLTGLETDVSLSVEESSVHREDRSAENRAESLKALREEIGDCKLCRLSKERKNIVFGEGNPAADLMFIGEGPGREEDIQARPFVGSAGKVLTSLIGKMGFNREDVYIANIVKCRPPMNRNPEVDEINACLPFLKKQIGIIGPKVIMTLGKFSSQALLGTDSPISRLRGRFYLYEEIPVMPTFHPAYLMRNPKDKWLTWEDALQVLEKLGKT